MTIRLLVPSDQAQLDAFLRAHRDTSMFLRGNVRAAGLEYRGQRLEAIYAGAFRDDRLVGVAAHCWNGFVLVQAPEQASELAQACVAWSGEKVTGLSGPVEQVQLALAGLRLETAERTVDGGEALYALDLPDLVVPEALSTGAVVCRPPRNDERDLLCQWRLAYDIETMGATDTPERRKLSAEFLDAQIAAGDAWVAVVNVPVSLSAFNARLPDIVQLGGIYTPPDLRGRGYAKAAVAAALQTAQAQGVSRAVLFTNNPSAARSYEAVGFRRIGSYSLILFPEPQRTDARQVL